MLASISTMTPPDRRPGDERRRLLAATTAPWLLVAATLLGLAGGLALDRWLGWTPWGVLVCSLAGIAVGTYLVAREGSR